LNELFIDGLVHISSLASDYYQFDPMRQRLIGENSRQVYQVGDPVTVKVAAVNLDDRQIDLLMVGDNTKGAGKTARKGSKPTTARQRVNAEGAKSARGKSSVKSDKPKSDKPKSDKPKASKRRSSGKASSPAAKPAAVKKPSAVAQKSDAAKPDSSVKKNPAKRSKRK
ncbi:MAG TPA: ribonuclease R, partial [Shewanella frigidimarina]|nr:ribonuclease R [Shewanella frigidimarina]